MQVSNEKESVVPYEYNCIAGHLECGQSHPLTQDTLVGGGSDKNCGFPIRKLNIGPAHTQVGASHSVSNKVLRHHFNTGVHIVLLANSMLCQGLHN